MKSSWLDVTVCPYYLSDDAVILTASTGLDDEIAVEVVSGDSPNGIIDRLSAGDTPDDHPICADEISAIQQRYTEYPYTYWKDDTE